MSDPIEVEEAKVRAVALQNANAIRSVRQRLERDLIEAKESLERRSDELAHSLALMRATLESTSNGILVTGADGDVTAFNGKFADMWRIPATLLDRQRHDRIVDFIGVSFHDPDGFRRRINEIHATAPNETFDLLETVDGRIIERVSKTQYIGSIAVGRVWSFQDITERKRAEEALKASEARLADAQALAHLGSWELDLAASTGVWSAEMSRLHDRDPALPAPTFDEFVETIHPEDRPILIRTHAQLSTVTEPVSIEYRHPRPDGSLRYLAATITVIRDAGENPVRIVGTALDITEKRKLEQQFLRAQRLESIGTLAGGIAHDLNNVLAPIILAIDVLKMEFPDTSAHELLATISSSAQRGADMVRQVLSFARGVEGRRMEIQVRQLIRDVEKIANETFLKHIQIRTQIPADLWPLTGDPTQLHQVLLNLCVNARDAMPNGGILTLAAENVTIDAHYAAMNLESKAGPYVLLQIEDDGCGIPANVIEKIFDPFFTTKEVGKGTGLGLSTSLAIIKSHGGFIRVYSEGGRGTTFKVYLPAKTNASAEAAAAATVELPRGDGQLILVIDDEASVRIITKQTLEAFGYRVLLASDGAVAVSLYATRGQEIAAVLTDMMMPGMDGPVTIRVLRRMNPKIRIIGASGLSTEGHANLVANLGVKHFLPKPYTADTLLNALKQVLSSEA